MEVIKNIITPVAQALKRFLSYHRYAIFFAIIVAIFAGAPQIIARNALGPADHGIPYLVNDAEGEYLGRVHEILDGHLNASSPILYEYKNSVALIPPTGELFFYALPVKITGLSLPTIVFMSKFIFPAIIFFFAYLFILSLLNKNDKGAQLSAIAGALLIVIGYNAADYRSFIPYVLHGSMDSTGLLWNRLVNPTTGAMLLFAFIWLISRIVSDGDRWLTVIFSSLILSIMSGYIFSFALGLTIPVFVSLYFIWRKKWPIVLRLYIPVMTALLVNGYYFVHALLTAGSGVFLSDARKSGMFLTHEPLINLISLAGLIGATLCFGLFYRKDTANEEQKRWWFFLLVIAFACEFVYNQQIITGRTIWPQHFVRYTTTLSMAIMVVFLHNILRPRWKNLWHVTVVILFSISALFGWRAIEAVQYSIPQYADLQSFSGVFDYLNINVEKDCVVYVSSDYANEINRFIGGFTGCNVYSSFNMMYSGVPDERVMHNYLVDLRLRGIKLKDLDKYLKENSFWLRGQFFRDWNDLYCCGDPWLKKIGDQKEMDQHLVDVGKDVKQKYTEFLKGDLYSELSRYRLDYFVVDTEKQPKVNEKNFPFLSFRGKFDRFAVYVFVKPSNI